MQLKNAIVLSGHPPMICATATGGRECGGEVTCHKKSSTVLSEPKFGPPPPLTQQKIAGSAPAMAAMGSCFAFIRRINCT